MDILFLCHKMPYPPNDGGVIATLNMINGFATAENKVTVLAMQTPKHHYHIESLPQSLKETVCWNTVKVNTQIKPIQLLWNLVFSSEPYNAERFKSESFKQKLVGLLKSEHFDIIQLEGLYLYSYIDVIRQNCSAKIVLRAHNIEHEIWMRMAANESNWIKRWYKNKLAFRIKKIERETINKIDLLVPITNRDAEWLSPDNRSNVHVSPTGLPKEQFVKGVPKNPKTIFYIGALDWIPNQDALVWFIEQVWKNLVATNAEWKFFIAGRNAPKNLVQLFEKEGVSYVGEVESATQFIDDYNIMVVPLLAGSGMRIKIVEGMARGKCIVTTSIGAEGIGAKNGESIYIADTAHEMTAILNNLMHNTNEINTCGENAFKFVADTFNNETQINELSLFYKKHLNILE